MIEQPLTELKEELRNAIRDHEFILYYQPQFNLTTAKFEGVEALIRWQHPKRGLLLPTDFMFAVEEDLDLIIPITKWAIATACQQNKAWQNSGLPSIRMAVNVTETDLRESSFIDFVETTLKQIDLHAECLEIELTENILLNDNNVLEHIHRLKKLGVIIALDDFGTGYSSISHLRKLPVDRIKIAKTFIDHINADENDAAIVRAIITLAETLKMQVVAEGVESVKQLQCLTTNHIEIQGFYFSEPLPANDVEKFLMSYQDRKFLSSNDR